MKKYAVIVAGGAGTRMESTIPKQFLLLGGKPLLSCSIDSFLLAYSDLQIILVLADQDLEKAQETLAVCIDASRIRIAAGGKTRFHSVKNGLALVPDDAIVFIHDGVRCLVTVQLIHRCYEMALEKGNAIPAIKATDSMRIEKDGANQVIDREKIKLIQTPQTFQAQLIRKAFEQEYREIFTDEATVLEQLGYRIHLVAGEDTNIKITRPLDLLLAEKIIESRVGKS